MNAIAHAWKLTFGAFDRWFPPKTSEPEPQPLAQRIEGGVHYAVASLDQRERLLLADIDQLQADIALREWELDQVRLARRAMLAAEEVFNEEAAAQTLARDTRQPYDASRNSESSALSPQVRSEETPATHQDTPRWGELSPVPAAGS